MERLYPTCTSFCHYHASYPAGLVEATERGVIFLMAWWSGPAVERFKFSCYALENNARLVFHVVDADGLDDTCPLGEKERLGGYGEVFWIKSGAIFRSMGAEWSKERFEVDQAATEAD